MICSRCKTDLDESEFISGKKTCLKCYRYRQKYYKENRKKEIERAKRHANKDRQKTNKMKREAIRKNPVSYLLWNVKSRAKKKGLDFDLSHEDIIIPETCPIFGFPLKINSGVASFDSASVDRIDPSIGYVKGNVHVISHKANSMKNDATLDELKLLVEYLENKKQG